TLTPVTHSSSVAVIMSVYRGDTVELFRLAVESIKQQTYPCSLYIYRDGLVSTELQDQLNLYKSDPTISVVESQDSEGLANGLNALIEITLAGEFYYIARMDSDDISLPN
ncbi:glycosyltransferase, partial [Vibrio sp. F13]